MTKTIKQYRYFGNGNNLNSNSFDNTSLLTKEDLVIGSIFESNDFFSIATLGIQTLPGVEFYLNGSKESIIVGSSGVYELKSLDNYDIKQLRFKEESIDLIDSNGGAYLIIDIIYNKAEEA